MAQQICMERLSAAFKSPLSENRQQYERLLLPQEYADIRQCGETVLMQQEWEQNMPFQSAFFPTQVEGRRKFQEIDI